MQPTHRFSLVVVAFLPLALMASSSFAQSAGTDGATAVAALGRHVISAGAVSASSSTFRIAGTVGQPMVGVLGSSNRTASIGFWYRGGEIKTGVGASAPAPGTFAMLAFPNPLTSATTLRFRLENAGDARIDICDALGRIIRNLPAEHLEPGWHDLIWDGTNALGAPVPAGYYFAIVRSEGTSGTQSSAATGLKVVR